MKLEEVAWLRLEILGDEFSGGDEQVATEMGMLKNLLKETPY